MARYVTFGEIMLRLKPPGVERFFQSPLLEATFGGGEANVATALARFGCDCAFVSVIPTNAVGDACVAELRRHGIDTTLAVRKGSRLGIYFLEQGANQRPSVVIYDRAGSAIAEARRGRHRLGRHVQGRVMVPHHRNHAGNLAERRGAFPRGGARGKDERAHRILRPQLSQESLEVRQECARGDG